MVLEANHDHWNSQRGPRLERVVFRNDLPPADALELICGGEGEVDIVTEVSPADAQRVIASEQAKLVRVDAMRVLAGIVNWGAEGAPLRRAGAAGLNLAVDRGRLIREVFGGYAAPLAGLTPHYAVGVPAGQQPYQHDPDQARDLLTTAGWPAGRELRLTAPADLEAVARRLAEDFTASLGVEVDLTLIPADQLLAAQHALVEGITPSLRRARPRLDRPLVGRAAGIHAQPVLLQHGRVPGRPPIPEFDELLGRFAVATDQRVVTELTTDLDRFAYDQALSVFLCAPQALYAVNRHVAFDGYAATFELAETEVAPEHWSRR